jgi:hypothetical protein
MNRLRHCLTRLIYICSFCKESSCQNSLFYPLFLYNKGWLICHSWYCSKSEERNSYAMDNISNCFFHIIYSRCFKFFKCEFYQNIIHYINLFSYKVFSLIENLLNAIITCKFYKYIWNIWYLYKIIDSKLKTFYIDLT